MVVEIAWVVLAALTVLGVGTFASILVPLCRCAVGHWFFTGGTYNRASQAVYCDRHLPRRLTNGR